MSPWPATELPMDRNISGWTEMWHEDAPMSVQLSEYREQAAAVTIDRELIEDWKRNRAEVRLGPVEVTSLNAGNTVCFTGSGLDSTRAEWKAMAERAGLRVAASVTARVSALVAPADGGPGAKGIVATALGVPVISYESFLAALDEAGRTSELAIPETRSP
jgi:NAD-dependent DNA ligase